MTWSYKINDASLSDKVYDIEILYDNNIYADSRGIATHVGNEFLSMADNLKFFLAETTYNVILEGIDVPGFMDLLYYILFELKLKGM
jgi:ribonucleotide reductase beta subunit family protein with ferritin-like domain